MSLIKELKVETWHPYLINFPIEVRIGLLEQFFFNEGTLYCYGQVSMQNMQYWAQAKILWFEKFSKTGYEKSNCVEESSEDIILGPHFGKVVLKGEMYLDCWRLNLVTALAQL